jgi:hypothetical protein
VDKDILRKLEERLGPLHARQRLGIETDHEAQVFGQGLTFFHLENLYSAPAIIRNALKLTGLYWRARRNAERIIVKRNDLRFAALPSLFDGYTILHISDMHVDMSEAAMQHLIELVDGMQYDLCVLTGDYLRVDCGMRLRSSRFPPRKSATIKLITTWPWQDYESIRRRHRPIVDATLDRKN